MIASSKCFFKFGSAILGHAVLVAGRVASLLVSCASREDDASWPVLSRVAKLLEKSRRADRLLEVGVVASKEGALRISEDTVIRGFRVRGLGDEG